MRKVKVNITPLIALAGVAHLKEWIRISDDFGEATFEAMMAKYEQPDYNLL